MIRLIFDRYHWWLTILVLALMAGLLGLGFWQLDRLGQRQARNARTRAELAASPLLLNAAGSPADLTAMEYRTVVATGTYDFDAEIALRNQRWVTRPGVHLLTPLRLTGSDRAVLVDRGWIPLEDAAPARWAQYGTPAGEVSVRGVVRVPPAGSRFSLPEPTTLPGTVQKEWNLLRLDRLAAQLPYPLLPVYVALTPDPAWDALPARPEPDLDLGDGSHLGNAIQWFTFAALAAGGYAIYLRRSVAGR